MPRPGVLAVWLALIAAIAVPVVVAGFRPYLAWRSPIYIAAGFAGIIGLGLLLIQPLLAARVLPRLTAMNNRIVHRWVGITLTAMIVLHVGGLWITSPRMWWMPCCSGPLPPFLPGAWWPCGQRSPPWH